jgi:hypothetical protein
LGSGTPPKSAQRSYCDSDSYTNTLGPGYYNVPDTLIKKSFNTRVSGGNSARGSPTKSALSTPPPAPQSGRTSPTGTYVSISPLAQHSRAANREREREKERERERERVQIFAKSKGRGQGQGPGQGLMKAPTHTVMQGINESKKSTAMRERGREGGGREGGGREGGREGGESITHPVPTTFRNRESKVQYVYQTPK